MSEKNMTIMWIIVGMIYYYKDKFNISEPKYAKLFGQIEDKTLLSTKGWLHNREICDILRRLYKENKINTKGVNIEVIIKKIKCNINKTKKALKKIGVIECKKRKKKDKEKSKITEPYVQRIVSNDFEIFRHLYFSFLNNNNLDLFLKSDYFFDNVFGLTDEYVKECIADDFIESLKINNINTFDIYPLLFTDLFRYFLADPLQFNKQQNKLIKSDWFRSENMLSSFLLVKIYDPNISKETRKRLTKTFNLINTGNIEKLSSPDTEVFKRIHIKFSKEYPSEHEEYLTIKMYEQKLSKYAPEILKKYGGKIEEWNS
jgi:hypothetical protein